MLAWSEIFSALKPYILEEKNVKSRGCMAKIYKIKNGDRELFLLVPVAGPCRRAKVFNASGERLFWSYSAVVAALYVMLLANIDIRLTVADALELYNIGLHTGYEMAEKIFYWGKPA